MAYAEAQLYSFFGMRKHLTITMKRLRIAYLHQNSKQLESGDVRLRAARISC